LFDFIAGQMQELAGCDGDSLQMRLEKRKISRPQRGQETIAAMLLLIWTHAGPDSASARIPRRSLAAKNLFGDPKFIGHCLDGPRRSAGASVVR
jgi:hypothetical protein